MTQSLRNLKLKVSSLRDTIEEKGDGLVQQCMSTPHFLTFQVRFKGETQNFYFGRGAIYQGFDYSPLRPPAPLRIQDKFLQFARKYWRGLRVKNLTVADEDRVLELKVAFKGGEGRIWFFWRGRDLFFAHCLRNGPKVDLFKSWVGKCRASEEVAETLTVKDVFEGLGFGEGKDKERIGDLSITRYFKEQEKRVALKKAPSSSESAKNIRLKEKIQKDLRRFEIIPFLESQTKKDLTDVNQIGEGRFSINFKGLEGHYKKREYLFDKIKKWKKSKGFLEARLKSLSGEGKPKENKPNSFSMSLGKTIQPIWSEQKSEQIFKNESGFIKFSFRGVPCFLGRTALENDFIRKEKASKDDVWLHLENYKSGHLIIKTDMSQLLPEDIAILASALVELNGIELVEIPVIYTKVRFLKGVKGVPGMVNYKKEKHITVYFDREWRQKLSGIEVISDG